MTPSIQNVLRRAERLRPTIVAPVSFPGEPDALWLLGVFAEHHDTRCALDFLATRLEREATRDRLETYRRRRAEARP